MFGALLAPAALSLLTTTFTEPGERAKAFGIFGAIGVGLPHRNGHRASDEQQAPKRRAWRAPARGREAAGVRVEASRF